MNILLCMAESPDGCTWYRVQQFVDSANRQKLAEHRFLKWSLSDAEMANLITQADVFLLRLNDKAPTIVKTLKASPNRRPIILDIDDSYDHINVLSDMYRILGTDEVKLEDGSYLWKDGEGKFDLEANRQRIASYEQVMREVDAIIVTTLTLRTYALQFNPNVVVVPNSIDPVLFPDVSVKRDNTIRIVWSGGSSHYDDLAEIAPVIREILREYPNVEYHHVGQRFPGIFKMLDSNRVFQHRWLHPEAHGYRLATLGGDIGLCPIKDEPFNRYKSSVKFYEYSMSGMATIARGIEPYTDDITNEKTGLLYNSNDELKSQLVQLINDPVLRVSMARSARNYVEANRDVDAVTRDWVAFLSGVADALKGGHATT